MTWRAATGAAPREAHAVFDALIRCAPLRARLDDPRLRVIDCRFDLADTSRGESAFADAHLPGARYAHLDHETPARSKGPGPQPTPYSPRLADGGSSGTLAMASKTSFWVIAKS